jgi:hypothetical protein
MISSSTLTQTDRLGSANNTALLNSPNELDRHNLWRSHVNLLEPFCRVFVKW